MAKRAGSASTPNEFKSLLSSFVHETNAAVVRNEKPSNGEGIEDGSSTTKSDKLLLKSMDRDAYLGRVQTFHSLTWFAKPMNLSPLHCARFGWQNVDTDILQCVSCRAYVSGHLPQPRDDARVYGECCDRVLEKLSKGHHLCCSWANNPCPEYFMDVPIGGPEEAVTSFKDSTQQLCSLETQLPQVDTELLQEMGLSATTLEKLAMLGTNDEHRISSEITQAAAVLALCGWKHKTQSVCAVICCDYCQRDVGLWSFLSLAGTTDIEEDPVVEAEATVDDGQTEAANKAEEQNKDPERRNGEESQNIERLKQDEEKSEPNNIDQSETVATSGLESPEVEREESDMIIDDAQDKNLMVEGAGAETEDKNLMGEGTDAEDKNLMGEGTEAKAVEKNPMVKGTEAEAEDKNLMGEGTEAEDKNPMLEVTEAKAEDKNLLVEGTEAEAEDKNLLVEGTEAEAEDKNLMEESMENEAEDHDVKAIQGNGDHEGDMTEKPSQDSSSEESATKPDSQDGSEKDEQSDQEIVEAGTNESVSSAPAMMEQAGAGDGREARRSPRDGNEEPQEGEPDRVPVISQQDGILTESSSIATCSGNTDSNIEIDCKNSDDDNPGQIETKTGNEEDDSSREAELVVTSVDNERSPEEVKSASNVNDMEASDKKSTEETNAADEDIDHEESSVGKPLSGINSNAQQLDSEEIQSNSAAGDEETLCSNVDIQDENRQASDPTAIPQDDSLVQESAESQNAIILSPLVQAPFPAGSILRKDSSEEGSAEDDADVSDASTPNGAETDKQQGHHGNTEQKADGAHIADKVVVQHQTEFDSIGSQSENKTDPPTDAELPSHHGPQGTLSSFQLQPIQPMQYRSRADSDDGSDEAVSDSDNVIPTLLPTHSFQEDEEEEEHNTSPVKNIRPRFPYSSPENPDMFLITSPVRRPLRYEASSEEEEEEEDYSDDGSMSDEPTRMPLPQTSQDEPIMLSDSDSGDEVAGGLEHKEDSRANQSTEETQSTQSYRDVAAPNTDSDDEPLSYSVDGPPDGVEKRMSGSDDEDSNSEAEESDGSLSNEQNDSEQSGSEDDEPEILILDSDSEEEVDVGTGPEQSEAVATQEDITDTAHEPYTSSDQYDSQHYPSFSAQQVELHTDMADDSDDMDLNAEVASDLEDIAEVEEEEEEDGPQDEDMSCGEADEEDEPTEIPSESADSEDEQEASSHHLESQFSPPASDEEEEEGSSDVDVTMVAEEENIHSDVEASEDSNNSVYLNDSNYSSDDDESTAKNASQVQRVQNPKSGKSDLSESSPSKDPVWGAEDEEESEAESMDSQPESGNHWQQLRQQQEALFRPSPDTPSEKYSQGDAFGTTEASGPCSEQQSNLAAGRITDAAGDNVTEIDKSSNLDLSIESGALDVSPDTFLSSKKHISLPDNSSDSSKDVDSADVSNIAKDTATTSDNKEQSLPDPQVAVQTAGTQNVESTETNDNIETSSGSGQPSQGSKRPLDQDEASSVESTERTAAKKARIKMHHLFDPVAEHRAWCPWVTKAHLGNLPENYQSDDTAQSHDVRYQVGWQRLLDIVLHHKNPERSIQHIVHTTPPHESLRNLRRIFNEWTSPQAVLTFT